MLNLYLRLNHLDLQSEMTHLNLQSIMTLNIKEHVDSFFFLGNELDIREERPYMSKLVKATLFHPIVLPRIIFFTLCSAKYSLFR